MTCIPIAFVQADWGAIGTWAGAGVSAVVVWAAFQVQRDTAREAARQARKPILLASKNGLIAVQKAAQYLEATAHSLGHGGAAEILLEDLDRRIRVLDFFLSQPAPVYATLEMLIAIRADAAIVRAAVLREIEIVNGDDDSVLNGPPPGPASAWAKQSIPRWEAMGRRAAEIIAEEEQRQ